MFSSFMLEPFGLQPDDVGINTGFLTVRAAVVVGIAVILLLLTYVIIRPILLRYVRRENSLLLRPLVLVAQILYFGLFAFPLVAILRYWSTLTLIEAVALASFVSLIAVGIEAAILARALGLSWLPYSDQIEPLLPSPMARASAVFMWLVPILPLSIIGGLAVGHTVYRGNPVENPFVSMPVVEVYLGKEIPAPIEPTITTTTGGLQSVCGIDLGSDGQTLRIWDPIGKHLFSFPSDYVTMVDLSSRCSSSDHA